MIIGLHSASLIRELNAELVEKTRILASERMGVTFESVVPWMCMVCLKDVQVKDPSIFFDHYSRGDLIISHEQLQRIANLMKNDGRLIVESVLSPNAGVSPSQRFSIIEDLRDEAPMWSNCYSQARALLLDSDEFFPALFYDLVHFVVPIEAGGKFDFSTHLARGAIFFSAPEPPEPEIGMAIDLAHELGHQALMVFQSADPLLTSPLDQPVWSAIRQTFRPAIQSMQAAAAMGYMILFMKGALKNATLSEPQRRYLEDSLMTTINGMRETVSALGSCQFTPLGNQIFIDFSLMLEP